MFSREFRRLVLICGFVAAAVAIPRAERAPALDLLALLDGYAAGRFDETIRTIQAASDDASQDIRIQWPTAGRKWIDRTPEDRHRRLLVAASLLLEMENIRVERGDWFNSNSDVCQLLARFGSDSRGTTPQCLINWAHALLLERGDPDSAEYAWTLAATALIEGVRDWRFLHVPVRAPEGFVLPIRREGIASALPARSARPVVQGLLDRALDRFPDDPQLKFHAALAIASAFNITVDGGRSTADRSYIIAIGDPTIRRLSPQREDAVAMLSALRDDPIVGDEARLRLGYLQWTQERDAEARAELQAAATRTNDQDLKYLARFLLGWTALQRGDSEEAKRELATALEIRPNSQSAVLALAALQMREGEASSAYDLAETSLVKRRNDDDPWRLFLYGHHPHLPKLVADLRSKTR